MNNLLIALVVIILAAGGTYFLFPDWFSGILHDLNTNTPAENQSASAGSAGSQATTTPTMPQKETVIGTSVGGRPIPAYHYYAPVNPNATSTDTSPASANEIVFVGGIHGGYSWNTVLVARELKKYLDANPAAVPAGVKVTVIPVLNPDGLVKTFGTDGEITAAQVPADQSLVTAGRFNGNTVDLNRNFDCDWQTNATWQNKTVSGGTAAFSEPEAKAIQSYIQANNPKAVVVWYSAAGGVFASNCHGTVSAETKALTNAYATASGYKAYEEFDFYETTGDLTNWLAKINTPAISVLLTSHDAVEWDKNWKGIQALLARFAQ